MTSITNACTPTLPPAEVNDLCRRYAAGDNEALEMLVSSHLAFVTSVAQRYSSLGVPVEDLISEGILGLIEAVKRFDTERGYRFLTYAVFWIRRHILDALRRDSQPIRRPRTLRPAPEPEQAFAPRTPCTSRTVSLADARNRVGEAGSLSFQSIDHATVDSDDVSTIDTLQDSSAECPEDRLMRDDTRRVVWTALKGLRPNQQLVVALRHGLCDDQSWTLRQVGELIGISRERVRQIEMQGVEQLRRGLCRVSAAPLLAQPVARTRLPLRPAGTPYAVRDLAAAVPALRRRSRSVTPRSASAAMAGAARGAA